MIYSAESNRYSLATTSDYHTQTQGYDTSTYDSAYGNPPRRTDPNQLLMLPAPLSVSRTTPTSASASASTAGLSRSSEEGGYASDIGSSQHRLVASSPEGQYPDDYDSPMSNQYSPQSTPFDARVSRTAGANNAIYHRTSANYYPVETQSPYGYARPQTAGYDDPQQFPYTTEPEEYPAAPQAAARQSRSRGVSLADNGPVPVPGGVRRVSRQPNKRPTSQVPPQNRYSRGSSLPPGAMPPQPGYGF